MANGAAQMVQPLLAGYARDNGVPPRYILGLSAAFVATVPFLQTLITSPFYAILYGTGENVRLFAVPFHTSLLKIECLPRQARDKHIGNFETKKRTAFLLQG
jgi:hypothetical protein